MRYIFHFVLQFFSQKISIDTCLYIYIYNFFLFVGLISVICWFLHCRRESDQALWHFYWVWVFDSLTWGVEMGVAVQHLPQIIQWLAQVAIHFSTLTSGFRWFFFVPPNRGVEIPWKSEWRSLEVFHTPSRAVRFPPAHLGICLALFFNLPLMSHKMPLHELKQKQCKKKGGEIPFTFLHSPALFPPTFSFVLCSVCTTRQQLWLIMKFSFYLGLQLWSKPIKLGEQSHRRYCYQTNIFLDTFLMLFIHWYLNSFYCPKPFKAS